MSAVATWAEGRLNSGTLADAAGSLAAGHVGQGGVAGAAGNLDRLVREGEGGVKEVKIQCGDVAFRKS